MDAIILIAALLSVSIPFAIAKLWWWVWFWVVLAALLGTFEYLAKKKTGKTLSEQFWTWRRKVGKPWERWLVLIGMIIFWSYLIWHLYPCGK